MDCEDGVEEVRVEEVGEAGRGDGGYGGGLVGQRRDEEDGAEGEVVFGRAGDGGVPVEEVVGEAVD